MAPAWWRGPPPPGPCPPTWRSACTPRWITSKPGTQVRCWGAELACWAEIASWLGWAGLGWACWAGFWAVPAAATSVLPAWPTHCHAHMSHASIFSPFFPPACSHGQGVHCHGIQAGRDPRGGAQGQEGRQGQGRRRGSRSAQGVRGGHYCWAATGAAAAGGRYCWGWRALPPPSAFASCALPPPLYGACAQQPSIVAVHQTIK